MVLSISLHDAAQAWMASRLGDQTARLSGRLTLNPVPHFDFFGMALWPLIFIWRSPLVLGWGKPVPMISRNFRHPKDEIRATLAGPGAQFAAAVVCLLVLLVVKHAAPAAARSSFMVADLLSQRGLDFVPPGLPPMFPLILFLYFGILVNLLLAIFNLLPLPFLDGGKILVYYLPYNAARTYERYSLWLMFGFMFFGFGVILAIFAPVLSVFDRLLYGL
jgi:Zn-dependent protease